LKGKVRRDKYGAIITDKNMRTNVDMVYAAGDVRKKELKQIVTACADGAVAVNSVAADLRTCIQ
jgi:thioredoxin reductase (NADPH)